MTTDHDTAIAAAEARLAEAQADVDRLRAQLVTEQTAASAEPTEPRKLTWDDGVAAARARFPGKTRSEQAAAGTRGATRPQSPTEAELDGGVSRSPQAAYAERHGIDITSVEGARAEARRRGAARKGGSR